MPAFYFPHNFAVMNNPLSIRRATAADMPAVFKLVKELAEYEKAPHEVIVSAEDYVRDGFGEKPLFGCFVAENENDIVGISLYYWRYSTWKGKRLYLEDIVVTEKMRGAGIGKLLFERTMQEAVDENCSGMMWQVLDWNKPAINFYNKYRARLDGEWINGTLDISEVKQLLNA
ncbi:MAG: GCN5-like N-acetyltransferase [Bacteroidetes bacterium]|nr:MAG: GCN5-like N-acetyltransferase [Bacteroidota bacterium]